MLAVYLLISLLCCGGSCLQIPIDEPIYSDKLINCVTDIITKYFSKNKVMTYVGSKDDDEELMKVINTANVVSVVSRISSKRIPIQHEGYLIFAKNASHFATHIFRITKEPTWNPTARFLIIVKELKDSQLKLLFDTLLHLHVINVVVMNATEDAHLYGYNPFNNYGCGKYYDTVINHGKCSNTHSLNLYPNKIVTGLQNCTLNVLVPQWPPYTMIPTNDSEISSLGLGAEPYLLRLIGQMEGFQINITYDYDKFERFPTVSSDMEAVGSLKMLQDNEVDVVIGGMLLIPSRAVAFGYIYGHFTYTDEIRFVVKRASFVLPWKNVYLEFDSTVWILLIIALVVYSMLIIYLLRTKDKSYVVLSLLDNLVLHGSNIQCRMAVKCVLIMWMWFAYLVNTFYQSSLVSLTTHPAQEYQISKEEDIAKNQLKPCFSTVMRKYYAESAQSDSRLSKIDGCTGLMESLTTTMKSKDLYTIMLYGIYRYNIQDYFDEYGKPQVFSLSKPYSKVIYSMYTNKGFPLIHELRHRTIQLRENGVVSKIIDDMIFIKNIKHSYRQKEFRGRFDIPWRVYVIGCAISVITFIIEIISNH